MRVGEGQLGVEMAVLPPELVAGCFLVAGLAAVAFMVYTAWSGSKPSPFYTEAVSEMYELELPENEIDSFYDMKDALQAKVGVEADAVGPDGTPLPWAHQLPPEEKLGLQQALMRRLVKGIERLDQVQRDKPGNWKLWRGKLVSERFWASLCEAERVIGEEIDICLSEAEELEPGWREHIFQQAVHIWRMEKNQQLEKKEQKKAVVQEKKAVVKEARRAIVEVKQAEEAKIREERNAEKMMEKLLREEEAAAKKDKKKGQDKVAAKPKAKKK